MWILICVCVCACPCVCVRCLSTMIFLYFYLFKSKSVYLLFSYLSCQSVCLLTSDSSITYLTYTSYVLHQLYVIPLFLALVPLSTRVILLHSSKYLSSFSLHLSLSLSFSHSLSYSFFSIQISISNILIQTPHTQTNYTLKNSTLT